MWPLSTRPATVSRAPAVLHTATASSLFATRFSMARATTDAPLSETEANETRALKEPGMLHSKILFDSQLATRLAIAFAEDSLPASLPFIMICARTSITPVLPINLSSSLLVLLVSDTISCAASALSPTSCDLSFGIRSNISGKISEAMEPVLPSPSSPSSSSSSGCHISALLGFFGLKRYFNMDTFRVRIPGAEAGPYMFDLPP
mmetsp:Transcript_32736/g.103592  ORF Transcript_32736/g.103592 Transcript_32736/m.103592 type:complete len:205 (-) Transcript_32736:138-752(-)